jgi:hypothetical protein
VRAIARRLHRLEDQFGADGRPRERFTVVGERLGCTVGATCYRTLCPNGIISESVMLGTSRDGRELTPEELDKWILSFPIEPMRDGLPLHVKPLTTS